jgi:hypothetical protein
MPGNLRYGLTSGLSTASKKRRPGSHYLESPFLLSKHGRELYTRFISSPAWDLTAESSLGGWGEDFYFAGKRCLGDSEFGSVDLHFLVFTISVLHSMLCSPPASVLAVTVECDEKSVVD